MPDSASVFISHSRKDAAFARTLVERLRAAGLHPWIDVESIPDGSTWPREIQKAVEDAAAMVVVMSEHGRDSEWVERETLLALNLGKPLFIALIDDTPMPLHLLNRQYTDFRDQPDAAFERLIAALHRAQPSRPAPGEHRFFSYVESLPEGLTSARVARALHSWATATLDSITFTGSQKPALNGNLWLGPGGLVVFSVRTYAQIAVLEIPLRHYAGFAPYDDRAERLALLDALNGFMPPDARFAPERADGRPNLPLPTALGDEAALARLLALLGEVVGRLRAAHRE